jgi:hypothetical protein
VEVVRESGPVQAQEPRAARLAFRARATSLTAADVDHARTGDRSLLRAWVMRKTVHLIPSEDAGWLVPLFAESTVRWSRGRLAHFGLDRRAQDRAMKFVHDAIDSEGPLTRREIGARLNEAGYALESEHKVHLWLLATLDGELCLGPDRGAYACLVRTSDWLGKPERRSREDSLAELAVRYLRGYAPASERDFARWAGLPLRDARAGLRAIASELKVRPDGLFELSSSRRTPKLPPPRLLGAYDPILLGWTSRAPLLGDHQEIVTVNGLFRPFALAGGAAVARWAMPKGEVVLEPFGRLAPAVRAALNKDAADVARFLAR